MSPYFSMEIAPALQAARTFDSHNAFNFVVKMPFEVKVGKVNFFPAAFTGYGPIPDFVVQTEISHPRIIRKQGET